MILLTFWLGVFLVLSSVLVTAMALRTVTKSHKIVLGVATSCFSFLGIGCVVLSGFLMGQQTNNASTALRIENQKLKIQVRQIQMATDLICEPLVFTNPCRVVVIKVNGQSVVDVIADGQHFTIFPDGTINKLPSVLSQKQPSSKL